MDQVINSKLLAANYFIGETKKATQKTAEGSITQLEKIISQVIGVMTLFAVIYFVFQIIFAGYKFISSHGDEKAMESARSQLTNSILGLTIVIVAVGVGSLIAKLAGIENVLNLESVFNSLGFK